MARFTDTANSRKTFERSRSQSCRALLPQSDANSFSDTTRSAPSMTQ